MRRKGKKKEKEGAVWRKCGRKSLSFPTCSLTRRRRMRQLTPGVREPGSAELPPLIVGRQRVVDGRGRGGGGGGGEGGGRDPSSDILLASSVISGALRVRGEPRDEDG